MEFNKALVYTAVNADELSAGDKVIVANTMMTLKGIVLANDETRAVELSAINTGDNMYRFKALGSEYNLAYLVERAENCTNCVHREGEGCKPNVSPVNCCPCYDREVKQSYIEPRAEKKCEDCTLDEICVEGKKIYKDAPCPYHRAKKHYRPFRGTGELIQAWLDKGGKWQKRELTMPLIWVQRKDKHKSIDLITGFNTVAVSIGIAGNSMQDLFNDYEFLDGSPCGVEE